MRPAETEHGEGHTYGFDWQVHLRLTHAYIFILLQEYEKVGFDWLDRLLRFASDLR